MHTAKASQTFLHKLNKVLMVMVAVLAVYIVAAPVLPQLTWWVGHWHHHENLALVQVQKGKQPTPTPIPAEDFLVIPRLNMKQPIYGGTSLYELSKGVWLIPGTSTPDKGSNTVMAGHRFTYTGPAVFYFLDKVQLSDRITVDWKGKEYTYKVAAMKVVPPTELAVQSASAKPELTLYTCTPLWTSRSRLVIQADLVGERS